MISTSFMTGDDGENVKDEDQEDLDTIDDCFDYTKNSNNCNKGFLRASTWLRPNPDHENSQIIKNSNQSATSRFLENSSLERQRLLACQLTPLHSKSPKLELKVKL